MSFLRTISGPRLAALCASAVAIAGGGTAIAVAGSSGGPAPPPKPLARAVHDGLTAPEVQGITARVKFVNHLIDSSGIQGANPLLSGATGRLWVSPGHGLRLELQSDNGDAQVVANQHHFFVYDGTNNTVYRGRLPRDRGRDYRGRHRVPPVGRIQRGIARARRHKLAISGPVPGNIAGQPAYTIRLAPGEPGGLLGAVELAWDAAHGLPLRVGVYARGNSDPVLELVATDVQYGPLAGSTFDIKPPAGADVVNLNARGRGHQRRGGKLPFAVNAPDRLAGLDRTHVRVLKRKQAAVVTYGEGPGAIVVFESPQQPEKQH